MHRFSIFPAHISDNIASINLCWKSHFYSKNLFMLSYNFLKDMPLGYNTLSLDTHWNVNTFAKFQ